MGQSLRVVNWLKENGATLISSVGTQTWELLTAAASDADLPLVLFIPATDNSDFERTARDTIREFELHADNVEFLPVFADRARSKEQLMKIRDQLVIEHADTIIPVSLRPGSNLAQLIASDLSTGRTVVEDFEIPYEKRKDRLAYSIDPARLNRDLAEITGRYLVHWTRSFHHKWPGEKQIDYYRDIQRSQTWPRSALDTLIRILTTRSIHASVRHLPTGYPCVSLSSLAPNDLLPLITWRARFRQMAFEPYGVGIARDLAGQLGIIPVHYGPSADSDIPRWLQQSVGKITDWRREREHRHLGDLDLSLINRGALIAFTHTPDEASKVEAATGIKTVAFVH